MRTITLQVQPDHIARLTHVRKPLTALAELIWNGLDADAARVRVMFDDGALTQAESIRVVDDGLGMSQSEAVNAFERLGGSWKHTAERTRGEQRQLHGRSGRGRFKAFALGHLVEWRTTSRAPVGPALQTITITGAADALTTFRVSDPADTPPGAATGTEVLITELRNGFRGLQGQAVEQELLEEFAIYLRQYPHVLVEYDGRRLDATAAIRHEARYSVPPVTLEDGRVVEATLDVIEWTFGTRRTLFLCDADGFAFDETTQALPSMGGGYSAYLRSPFIRELDQEHALGLENIDPRLRALTDAARALLRDHVRRRAAEAAADAVAEWKRKDVYPYAGEPTSAVEAAERQVFEVVALTVRDHLPSFATAAPKEQRLTFRLVKQALEQDPGSLQTILGEVLGLPERQRDELAALLKHTSLAQIISASRVVTERLDFLRALELLVFDRDVKKVLRERTQLHRILEHHTWIFGEHFHLTVSDQSLNEVLAKHRTWVAGSDGVAGAPGGNGAAGAAGGADEAEVRRLDGSRGIIDLMLSRTVPQPRADEHEHLVVELKAPKQPINGAVLAQARSYAFAVAADERFADTNTRWNFWAVSNTMTEDARRETRIMGLPEGVAYASPDGRITVWARTWGQLIDAARARLSFFQQQFAYEATTESALALLRRLHGERIPAVLGETAADQPDPEAAPAGDAAADVAAPEAGAVAQGHR
jgi:hypothetical protein